VRITYLHQYFATPDGSTGTRSYEFSRRLVSAGHEVRVITSAAQFAPSHPERSSIQRVRVDGITVDVIPVEYDNAMSFGRRQRSFFEFALQAGALAIDSPTDVVLATSTPLTIAFPGIAAKVRRRVPLVLEIRDLWPDIPIQVGALKRPFSRQAARLLERVAYRSSTHIIALSPGIADGVQRRGVSPRKISVIPNSCDTDLFRASKADRDQARTELGISESQILVVYAGTFGIVNRVDYLVDVAAEMRRLNAHVRFLLVGSGSEAAYVTDQAVESGVLGHNLEIWPRVPKTEIVRIYAAADIVTSIFGPIRGIEHNSANKFFDGLAARRPVAINYGGWQAEVLNETSAGIVLDRDARTAAMQLKGYLENSENLAVARVAAGDLAASRFSRDAHAEQLESVLLRASAKGRAN
jgi:glycosyltransferase involved in cell wall biosynthesis